MDGTQQPTTSTFCLRREVRLSLAKEEGFITFSHVRSSSGVNQFFGPFSQGVYELYLHLDGSCNILIDDRIYSPRRGDILLYRPNQLHSLISTSPYQERYMVWFTPNAFSGIPCEPPITALFDTPKASANHLVFPHAFSKSIMDKLCQISTAVRDNAPEVPYLIYGNSLRILVAIQNMLKQATAMPLDANSPTILVKIVNYIHSNFATTRTLEQICSHFGISRSQLTRLFTTHIGITPYAYLQNFKLSHAKQRLSQGASVTEACFESGFSDYSNFIQLFRKTVGISPLTYKKQHYGSTALIDTTD